MSREKAPPRAGSREKFWHPAPLPLCRCLEAIAHMWARCLDAGVISFLTVRELDVAGQINRALSGGGEVQVRAGLTVGESMVIAMIARACAPRGKRAFADWAATTYLPQLMKFAAGPLTSQHFWDQMNVMPTDKLPEIEQALVREVVRIEQLQLQALAYDTTNFYTHI